VATLTVTNLSVVTPINRDYFSSLYIYCRLYISVPAYGMTDFCILAEAIGGKLGGRTIGSVDIARMSTEPDRF
jgi:hypothetical protein